MRESDFEETLKRAVRQDFSAGTEEFRDALLAHCLAALDGDCHAAEPNDADPDALAAAGSGPNREGQAPFDGGRTSSARARSTAWRANRGIESLLVD